MSNSPATPAAFAKLELAIEHGQCTRTEFDQSVLSGLRAVPVNAAEACFVDAERFSNRVEVWKSQCDFRRRPQSREEAKFIVISLRLAPITVNGSDDFLSLLNPKRVWPGLLPLAQACTLQASRRIQHVRVVSISKREGAP